MLKISGSQEEVSNLISTYGIDTQYIHIDIIEMGSITDKEIEEFGSFTDRQKEIIKMMYSTHKKGTFPNPMCALY